MEAEPTMEQVNDVKTVVENVEEECDMDTEDLVIVPSLMLSSSPDDSSIQNSPRTPKDAMFYPFASGPDTLLLAPFPRKCRTSTLISGSSLECKVTDQCEPESERISENRLVDDVYNDLMEAIIESRAQEISASDDGCTTPTLENRVNDVAECCPDAPARTAENMKNTGKVSSRKKLDFGTAGLCRKLEF